MNTPKTRFIVMEYVSSRDSDGNCYRSCTVISTISGKLLEISDEPSCNVRHYIGQVIGDCCYPAIVDYSKTMGRRDWDKKTANFPQWRRTEDLKQMIKDLEVIS